MVVDLNIKLIHHLSVCVTGRLDLVNHNVESWSTNAAAFQF